MSDALVGTVLGHLTADAGLSEDARLLVFAALGGPDDLATRQHPFLRLASSAAENLPRTAGDGSIDEASI